MILSLYHQHSDQRCEPARLYPNGMAVFNICKTLQHECDGSSKEQIIKRKCRETRLKIASNQNLNSRKIKEVAIDKDRSFIIFQGQSEPCRYSKPAMNGFLNIEYESEK